MAIELNRAMTASLRAAYTPVVTRGKSRQLPIGPTPSGTDFQKVFKDEVTPSGASAVPPAAAAPPAAPGLLSTVNALSNRGFMVNPTGNNPLSGGTIPYNPDYYATLEATNILAQHTGGSVVDMRAQFSNNQAEYYINLPNGISINAGNLLAICTNPSYRNNPGIMDHMIAEMLNNNAIGTPGVGTGQYTVKAGQITYDPFTQVPSPPAPYHT